MTVAGPRSRGVGKWEPKGAGLYVGDEWGFSPGGPPGVRSSEA